MGWRGTLRSINAAAKRAAKESERKHKAHLKNEIANDAANAVENWKNYLEELVTLHQNIGGKIDWLKIANQKTPRYLSNSPTETINAQLELDQFKPSLLGHVFGNNDRKRNRLEEKLEKAKRADHLNEQHAKQKHQERLNEHNDDVKMANSLLNGDIEALKNVFYEHQKISNLELLGRSIKLDYTNENFHLLLFVNDDQVVPNFRRKQLASGRLSETKMPVGEFNELYQDHIASAAICAGAETLNILPINPVFVTCFSEMLNSSNGNIEETPILSVQIVRDNLDRINLNAIDPSDALQNFKHNMNFKRNKGFFRIETLV